MSINRECDVPHDIYFMNFESNESQYYGFAKFLVLPEPR